MSAVDINMYEKKKSHLFSLAIIFLVGVLILTIALYIYLIQLKNTNNKLQADMAQVESSIEQIEKNPEIQAYKIYSQNIGFLTSLEKNSNIPLFVAHLKKTFQKYNLDAQGFNYAGGKINLEVKGQTNTAGYAYEKVVKFLKEYNIESQEKNPLVLQKVTSFSGYDTIAYSVEFEVKK